MWGCVLVSRVWGWQMWPGPEELGPGVSSACVGASTQGAVERAAGAAGRDLRIRASVLGTGEVIFQNVRI